MKRPPSQPAPMHTYIVGQLYDPSRKSWPKGADYNFRAGEHELRFFLRRATPREIAAVGTGRLHGHLGLPEHAWRVRLFRREAP